MAIHPYNRRLHDEARARADYVQALRKQGRSWQEIGDMLGVSRQMAHRIGTRYKGQAKSSQPLQDNRR